MLLVQRIQNLGVCEDLVQSLAGVEPRIAREHMTAIEAGRTVEVFPVLVAEAAVVGRPGGQLGAVLPQCLVCGVVLADLAARGAIVRKLDSDGYNSIILLEIPLANTFGYTTLLRSLTRGLGVYVLTYEKHGVRRA